MNERVPSLSRLGLGCYPLGGGYGDVDFEQARATVDAALDAGWTMFDTAEAYLDSEERLGRILHGRRDRVFLATKVLPARPYSYEQVRSALDASLRRLRTDRIDLYQLHGPENWLFEQAETPAADLAETLARLVASGDVLSVGICNHSVEQLDALRVHGAPISAVQDVYSLYDREVEEELMPYAHRNDVAFLAYSPLGRGLLAESIRVARTFAADDERSVLPRFQPGVYEHYACLGLRLREWALDQGRTLPQLAVAWTLRRPPVTTTLIGAKTPAQVNAIASAEAWVLSDGDLLEIDSLVQTLPPEARDAPYLSFAHVEPDALRARLDRVRGAPHA